MTGLRSALRVLPLLTLACFALLGTPVPARAEAGRWTVRASTAWVAPTGGDLRAVLPAGGRFRLAVDDGPGLGLEVEFRPTPRFGVELAAIAADLDATLTLGSAVPPRRDAETSAFELFSAGVDYHPWPGRRLDAFVGAFAAITYFDDLIFFTELGRRDKLVFDDDVGFGVKLGLDLSFAAESRWLGSVGLRYVSAILEGEIAGQDGDLDPLILSVGLGYRF